MKSHEQQARYSLAQLIAHVASHSNGPINGLTYQELAFRIGRLTKHGEGHAHGMGDVLLVMGRLLKELEGNWGEAIPHIQSLVIKKTGKNRGLPEDGIKEFWQDYPLLTRSEKENRVRLEYQKILAFGSRWADILDKLQIQPVTITVNRLWFGEGSESEEHKALKRYVRDHPEIVGATTDWESIEEYSLPSLDEIDVLFRNDAACIAVEVKSTICDAFPIEYERGLYQTIKYRALSIICHGSRSPLSDTLGNSFRSFTIIKTTRQI